MAKDILIDTDTDGDLVITAGDFKIGTSDEQHVVLLVNTALGSWKRYPLAGIGIITYSASSGQTNVLRREIGEQMVRDGFRDVEVLLSANDSGAFDYYITGSRLD